MEKNRTSSVAQLVVHSDHFKSYLENSDDVKSDRHPTSSRTRKAREKLLRLSTEQFAELSTDVYDELTRRELPPNKKPESLLNVDHFHPKRNSARKKLATLPPPRFKDLVTDMFYEIERRNLNKPQNSNEDDRATTHLGIQAGTVIPTKSTLAWSSDESDDEEKASAKNRNNTDEYDHSNPYDRPNDRRKIDSFDPYNDSRKGSIDGLTNRELSNTLDKKLSDASLSSNGNKNLRLGSSSSFGSSKPINENELADKDHEISMLISEGEKMDKTITLHESTIKELTAKVENLEGQLRDTNKSDEENKAKIYSLEREIVANRSIIDQFENEKSSKSKDSDSRVGDLEQENSKLNFAIKNLEREKQANEKSYLELRDNYSKIDKDYKHILNEYKLLQERHNAALLTEEEVRAEVKDERKKAANKAKQLQDENANLQNQLEKIKADYERMKNQVNSQPNNLSRALNDNLNSRVSVNEISKIEKRLELVNNENYQSDDNDVENLKLQVLDWQKKYQNLREESIRSNITNDVKPADLSEKGIEQYLDSDGIIPTKSVVELNSLITSFLLIMNDDHLSTDLLFETITKITITAGNIANKGESINNGEQSALIKASVSHAITSTRFYAVHGKKLPKLVVQSAISEISFCVCNLIAAAKVSNSGSAEPLILGNDIGGAIYGDEDVSLRQEHQLNNPVSNSNINEPIVNARPLRMAKKEGETKSPIITTKRENPFTINFGLSPNILGKPKFGSPQPSNGQNSRNASQFSPKQSHDYLESPKSKDVVGLDLRFENNKKESNDRFQSENFQPDNKSDDGSIKQDRELKSIDSKSDDFKADEFKSDDFKNDDLDFKKPSDSVDTAMTTPTSRDFHSRKISDASSIPDTSVRNLSHSTPKKSSVSSLKAKLFEQEKTESKSANHQVASPPMRNVTPSGGILSRMKQLESLSNGGSPKMNQNEVSPKMGQVTNSPFSSINPAPHKSPLNSIHKLRTEGFSKPNMFTDLDEDSPLQTSVEMEEDHFNTSRAFGHGFEVNNDDLNYSETAPDTKPAKKLASSPSITTINENKSGNSAPKPTNGKTNINKPGTPSGAVSSSPLNLFQKPNTDYSSSNNESMPSPLQETHRTEKASEFNVEAFDIADPDNSLADLLLYLEHQTVDVISTIQTLLSAIKIPDSTTGTLKTGAKAIGDVVGQMFDATSVSMAQSRNVQLREHGRWVVQSLADCGRRMDMLCASDKSDDDDYAEKHFKQRLAGIAFDIAKCTKELVKTVEEASLKEEIAVIEAGLISKGELK